MRWDMPRDSNPDTRSYIFDQHGRIENGGKATAGEVPLQGQRLKTCTSAPLASSAPWNGAAHTGARSAGVEGTSFVRFADISSVRSK